MKLASKEYTLELFEHHQENLHWGTSGGGHAHKVVDLIDELGIDTILDYGCGKCTLEAAVIEVLDEEFFIWYNYDIAIEGLTTPIHSELVVCTDVMEHVEEEYVENVLAHINSLSEMAVYLYISCMPAGEKLSDGRNAHITQKSIDWWIEKIDRLIDGEKKYDKLIGRRDNRRRQDLALGVTIIK